jgi:hypothetical protein
MKKFLFALLSSLIIFSCYGVLNMEASTANMHKEQVVIHNGDSLWRVASKWTKPGEDVREVIYRIEQENKLTGKEYLQPGQIIVVPVRVEENMMASK